MEALQYPIGRFQKKPKITESERLDCILQIAEAPENLRESVSGLSSEQLDTPYRPSGWTVRQVVHHLPDSHMNAYVRMKLAITESQPRITPYNEKLWAELHDVKTVPVDTSLTLLGALHERWVTLLRSLSPGDFEKTLLHPEHGVINNDFLLQLYGWHGRHHVAHITSLRQRMGWK